jgi:hypothetical protein
MFASQSFMAANVRQFGNRGVFAGGYNGYDTRVNTIYYINIPTTGNATLFGQLTRNSDGMAPCSNG